MKTSENYQKALVLIDEAYQLESTREVYHGKSYPKELLYSIRMVEELLNFNPEASEVELLAARCQHLCRWNIPRSDYPQGRKGYHDWRSFLYQYQANKAAKLMFKAGFDNDSISQLKRIVGKQHIKLNASGQLIEDVACLVFLKYYIADFVDKHMDDEIKLIRIIHRTWGKMSTKGQDLALQLDIAPAILELILKALKRSDSTT